MAVVVMTRWKGGKEEEVVKIGKQAKVLWEKHGAEYFRLARFHTGMWTGEYMVAVRFSSMAAYGKAQDGLAKDAAYQKVMAQAQNVAQLMGRNIVVGIDL